MRKEQPCLRPNRNCTGAVNRQTEPLLRAVAYTFSKEEHTVRPWHPQRVSNPHPDELMSPALPVEL